MKTGMALSIIAAAAIFWRAAETFLCAYSEKAEDPFESDDIPELLKFQKILKMNQNFLQKVSKREKNRSLTVA